MVEQNELEQIAERERDDSSPAPKRGRGRPLGSTKAQPAKAAASQPDPIAAMQLSASILYPLVKGVTVGLETRYGVEFQYSDEQRQTIAELLSAVVNKYSAVLLSKYGEEFALLAYVGMDAYSRISARRERLVKETEAKPSKKPGKVASE